MCDSGKFLLWTSILQGPLFRPTMVEYCLWPGKSCSDNPLEAPLQAGEEAEKGSHSICVVCSTLREINLLNIRHVQGHIFTRTRGFCWWNAVPDFNARQVGPSGLLF
jgi:hypothetical protein